MPLLSRNSPATFPERLTYSHRPNRSVSATHRGIHLRHRQEASGYDASRSPQQAPSRRCRKFTTNTATPFGGSARVSGNTPPSQAIRSSTNEPLLLFLPEGPVLPAAAATP